MKAETLGDALHWLLVNDERNPRYSEDWAEEESMKIAEWLLAKYKEEKDAS